MCCDAAAHWRLKGMVLGMIQEHEKTLDAKSSEHALIIANANRLLWDAKLLADHSRFASAFALAVLGLEEIGKVILDIWGSDQALSKPVIRRTVHVRKQAAIGALLLASFAVAKFGDMDAEVTVTDDLTKSVAEAFRTSREGQFLAHIQDGVLEKTKHVGIYRDEWLTAASLDADQFNESDVSSVFDIANRVLAAVVDERVMHTGRALYETSP
jgi:AbiV family abortive infection protein